MCLFIGQPPERPNIHLYKVWPLTSAGTRKMTLLTNLRCINLCHHPHPSQSCITLADISIFSYLLSAFFCFVFFFCLHAHSRLTTVSVKLFVPVVIKGKERKDKSKHTKTEWLHSSHGKHVKKRIYFFFFVVVVICFFLESKRSVMWLQGVGTRRRPCASRLSTHNGAPSLGAGVSAVSYRLWRRPLQRRRGHLHIRRVISVSSPYILMGSYISLLLLF